MKLLVIQVTKKEAKNKPKNKLKNPKLKNKPTNESKNTKIINPKQENGNPLNNPKILVETQGVKRFVN